MHGHMNVKLVNPYSLQYTICNSGVCLSSITYDPGWPDGTRAPPEHFERPRCTAASPKLRHFYWHAAAPCSYYSFY